MSQKRKQYSIPAPPVISLPDDVVKTVQKSLVDGRVVKQTITTTRPVSERYGSLKPSDFALENLIESGIPVGDVPLSYSPSFDAVNQQAASLPDVSISPTTDSTNDE